jgi:hypothetical protein
MAVTFCRPAGKVNACGKTFRNAEAASATPACRSDEVDEVGACRLACDIILYFLVPSADAVRAC